MPLTKICPEHFARIHLIRTEYYGARWEEFTNYNSWSISHLYYSYSLHWSKYVISKSIKSILIQANCLNFFHHKIEAQADQTIMPINLVEEAPPTSPNKSTIDKISFLIKMFLPLVTSLMTLLIISFKTTFPWIAWNNKHRSLDSIIRIQRANPNQKRNNPHFLITIRNINKAFYKSCNN